MSRLFRLGGVVALLAAAFTIPANATLMVNIGGSQKLG